MEAGNSTALDGGATLLASLQNVVSGVLAMRSGDDLEGVMRLLWNELRAAGVDLNFCGLNLIDRQAGTFQFYGAHAMGILKSRVISLEEVLRGAPPGFLRPELPNPGDVLSRQIPSAMVVAWMESLNAAGAELQGFDPSLMEDVVESAEVPFADGILVAGRGGTRNPFTSRELETLGRMADLFSLGYRRFLDFQRLERQNQALMLTTAVDRVQTEVGRMERSHDWGRVVRALVEELTALGVSLLGCSINIIDEPNGLFRQNMVLPRALRKGIRNDQAELVGELDADRDLWRVDRAFQPGRVPSPDAYAAWREGKTLIRRMSEEERERRFRRSFAIIGFDAHAREQFPRVTLDVPFSHGLIALTAASPDAFNDHEVVVVRQFVQVIETGYRRWLDIQELEDKNRKLETVNRELRETQAQLVQSAKMAAMGELVAGVAHEINTPLGAIKSASDVVDRLLARMPANEDGNQGVAQARELLSMSQSAVTRIVDIVRDLRTFARLDEADLQDADLEAGIESTLNLMRHETGDRIEIVRRYGELPLVRCYPNRMNQVFMNLLKNAVEAIEGRGTITIFTWTDADWAHLTFADNGQGIPAEHLGRIFDPGFTTKGVGVGTGLGLSICARIMEAHRGRISVASTVGEGTTFHLELPLHPPVMPAEVRAEVVAMGRGRQ